MKNFKKLSLSTIISLMMISGYSHADVIVYKTHDRIDENVQARFSQVGISGEKAKIISGYGKDMPFTMMTDIVVPDNWDITYNEGTEKTLVSWDGYVSWPYALKSVSEKNNINVSINWERKTVDFFSNEAFENAKNEKEKMLAEQEAAEREKEEVRARIALEVERKVRDEERLARSLESKQLLETNKSLEEKLKYLESLKEKEKDLVEKDSEVVAKNESEAPVISEEPKVEHYLSQEEIRRIKKEYENAFVLPLNDDIEYYLNGGYQEKIDFYTPAKFKAKAGYTLEQIINEWNKKIGFLPVEYKTRVHYTIPYEIIFEGDYAQVTKKLFESFKDADRALNISSFPKQNLSVVFDLQHGKNKTLTSVKGN